MRFTLAQLKTCTATVAKARPGKPMTLDKPISTAIVAASTDGKLARGISADVALKASGSIPHDLLWEVVDKKWPGRAVREYDAGVPGRKFRIDIAFPDARLAIEMDGWQFHGKFKNDFIKDRERQNLLCLRGWRVLRFTAGMIYKQMDEQIDSIERALHAQVADPLRAA